MAVTESDKRVSARLKVIVDMFCNGKSRPFALSIGMDPSQYNKIEKGSASISIEKIIDVSSKYGVSIEWLIAGEGHMLKKEKPDPFWEPDLDLLTLVRSDVEALQLSLRRLSESIPSLPQEENTDQGNAYEEFQVGKSRKAGKL